MYVPKKIIGGGETRLDDDVVKGRDGKMEKGNEYMYMGRITLSLTLPAPSNNIVNRMSPM